MNSPDPRTHNNATADAAQGVDTRVDQETSPSISHFENALLQSSKPTLAKHASEPNENPHTAYQSAKPSKSKKLQFSSGKSKQANDAKQSKMAISSRNSPEIASKGSKASRNSEFINSSMQAVPSSAGQKQMVNKIMRTATKPSAPKEEDIRQLISMRQKHNNSDFKQSTSTAVVFNGNPAINEFKKSIPELTIKKEDIVFNEQFEHFQDEAPATGYGVIQSETEDKESLKGPEPDLRGNERILKQINSFKDRVKHSNNNIKQRIEDDRSATSRVMNQPKLTSEVDKDSLQSFSQISKNKEATKLTDLRGSSSEKSLSSSNLKSIQVKPSLNNPSVLLERPENEEVSPQQRRGKKAELKEEDLDDAKSENLRFDKLLEEAKNEEPKRKPFNLKQGTDALYPPPEEIYKSKITVKHECVNYGLNMCFKKNHEFSSDTDQAGGDLAPNQSFLSQPWGANGCPIAKQENLTDYVRENIRDVVFCRYGMEYLKSFPRVDDLAIGSYRINLDYLIFNRQRNLDQDNNQSLVGMSFLKTKGQVEMNRQIMQQTTHHSPDRKGSSNFVGGSPSGIIIPFYKQIADKSDTTLYFDSVFESGNLAIALKVSENEYNLVLQNDINTNGHTQWFFFKVKSNFKKRTAVKFNLINLYKPKSLYQFGMRVLTLNVSQPPKEEEKSTGKSPARLKFNKKKKSSSNAPTSPASPPPPSDDGDRLGSDGLPKWKRSCRDICYTQNKFTNDQCPNGLYSIQFTYDFERGEQEIYFSHSMPYTYSMLTDYLNKNVTKEKAKRQTLCHSLAGNKVEYLHITNKQQKRIAQQPAEDPDTISPKLDATPQKTASSPFKRQKSLPKKKKLAEQPKFEKQVILITSRVHPGETNASYMVQGMMDSLLSPSKEEEELVRNLKDHFEIYIIPMLNVDGVINGNYRCSLASCDLNRKWLKPSKSLHPPVYYTKKLCQNLMETDKKSFFLYLDLHGHSAKKNIFQYGNKTEQWSPSKQKPSSFLAPSVFPLMVSRQFDYFNFQDCTFSMPKTKEATARISMFHKLRIPFVFTLEASFAGANKGALAGKHFSVQDLLNVGKYVLKAIWEVKKLELNKNLLKQITDEATKQAKSNEDGEESEGCSSSEEEAEPPASKKAVQIIQEQETSPVPKRPDDGSQAQAAGLNPALGGSPQKSRMGMKAESNRPAKQNKSIINLKTIQNIANDGGTQSKSNSPRKTDLLTRPSERLQGSIYMPVRRSIKPTQLNGSQISQHDSSTGRNPPELSMMQGVQGGDSPHLRNYAPADSQSFDILKNLVKAENPDDSVEGGGDNQALESLAQQQELFEQFNCEIEKSFTEQQQHLDDIFLQTAKKFLQLQNRPEGQTPLQYTRYGQLGQQRQHHWAKSSAESSASKNPNTYFLDQFLSQQRKQNIREKAGSTESALQNLLSQFHNQGQNTSSMPSGLPFLNENLLNPLHQQQMQTTFTHLQKLHQMQKINQMAQMQFFRQQAELLLSQNLTQQQQWELFQQFSYYQAQIQMQNQQYQIMLSSFLYSFTNKISQNLNHFKPFEGHTPQGMNLQANLESPIKQPPSHHKRFASTTLPPSNLHHAQFTNSLPQKQPGVIGGGQTITSSAPRNLEMVGSPADPKHRSTISQKFSKQHRTTGMNPLVIQNLTSHGLAQSEWNQASTSLSQQQSVIAGEKAVIRQPQEANNSDGLMSHSSSKYKGLQDMDGIQPPESQLKQGEDSLEDYSQQQRYPHNSLLALNQSSRLKKSEKKGQKMSIMINAESNHQIHNSSDVEELLANNQIGDKVPHIKRGHPNSMMRGSLEHKQIEALQQEAPGLKLKKGFTDVKASAPSKQQAKQFQLNQPSASKNVPHGLLSPHPGVDDLGGKPSNSLTREQLQDMFSQPHQQPLHQQPPQPFPQLDPQNLNHMLNYHLLLDQQIQQQLEQQQVNPMANSFQPMTQQKFFSTRGARQKQSSQLPKFQQSKKQSSFKSAKYPNLHYNTEISQEPQVPQIIINAQPSTKVSSIQANININVPPLVQSSDKKLREPYQGPQTASAIKDYAKPASQNLSRGNTGSIGGGLSGSQPHYSQPTGLSSKLAGGSHSKFSRHQASTLQQNRQNIDMIFQSAEKQKQSKFAQEVEKIDEYINSKSKQKGFDPIIFAEGQFVSNSGENTGVQHYDKSRGLSQFNLQQQKGVRQTYMHSQQANYSSQAGDNSANSNYQ